MMARMRWIFTRVVCRMARQYWHLYLQATVLASPPLPPLPGVVPGEGSTSQPNVPDVHCCDYSIFDSCTNQQRVHNQKEKEKKKEWQISERHTLK